MKDAPVNQLLSTLDDKDIYDEGFQRVNFEPRSFMFQDNDQNQSLTANMEPNFLSLPKSSFLNPLQTTQGDKFDIDEVPEELSLSVRKASMQSDD